jgi:hypothetical protein
MKRCLILTLGVLVALAPGAFAQIRAGNVYGAVTDEQGAVLPGVTVTLSGDLGTRSTVSTGQGEFRFLAVDAGRYTLSVSLTGFATVARNVVVTTGENVNLSFTLKVAGVSETVTVSGETPLVDVKKRGTSTTLVTDELERTPNARDPWGVLKNVPGVLVDRVNIAGNENGQQANYGAKGSIENDAVWNIDGLVVTDMTALGGSSSYYDFEAFQEINVTTGGADLQIQDAGVGINLVTKRGTNKFHGGGRFFMTHDKLQSSNLPSSLVNDPRLENPDGSFRDKADHIQQIGDYGFDLGGPIIKDRLWFYGSWGKQDVRLVRLSGLDDKTALTSYNVKLNWQATRDTMVSGFWFDGKKEKVGRDPGIPGITQPTASFLWNQGNAYEQNRPHGLWKLEVNQTFSPNFFVSAKAAYYNTGFGLIAAGPADQGFTYDFVDGVGIGSYENYFPVRPQKDANVDGSYFFQGTGGNHELKFGFGYRAVTTSTTTHYNGNQLWGAINSPTDYVAFVARDSIVSSVGDYLSFYAGDTFTKDRLSVNVGLRWDRQTSRNSPSTVAANASFPELLPALDYAGNTDNSIDWKDWSPRVGLSYALDDARKTVVRASYARYASQLNAHWVAQYENPVASAYLAYAWNDLNGDKLVQPNEVLLDQFLYNSSSVNPANPGAVGTTASKIDRNFTAFHTDEFIVGVDHELMPNFAAGVNYTWRRNSDLPYRPRIAGACGDNPTLATCPIIEPNQYTALAPVTAGGYTVTPYAPDPALVTAGGGGRLLTNQPGYTQNFNGAEVNLTKRMSNKWMGRLAFSWNMFKQSYSGVTPVNGGGGLQGGGSVTNANGNPMPTDLNSLTNDFVAAQSGGSGRATFYTTPTWQIYANGLVELPWKLDLSAAVFGRQGQVMPVYIVVNAGRDGSLNALATPTVDAFRYNAVWDADLRLAKTVKVGSTSLTLSAEGFNIFNSGTVLQEFRRVNSASYQRIDEILSPRIFRFGARLGF